MHLSPVRLVLYAITMNNSSEKDFSRFPKLFSHPGKPPTACAPHRLGQHSRHLVLSRRRLPPPSQGCPRRGQVTKIAIDKRARESENRGHEENRARVLPASGRLRGEEAASCGDPASHTEPDAATHCRTHRTLCSSQAGKCQHGDLQLSAHDHRDRFKDGAHHASLQENERRTTITRALTAAVVCPSHNHDGLENWFRTLHGILTVGACCRCLGWS